MITWLVILTIVVVLMGASLVGQHSRINEQTEIIAHLSEAVALMIEREEKI